MALKKHYQKSKKVNRKALVVAVVILLGLVYDLVGLGGNVRFYAKWLECDRKPVIADQSIGFGASPPSYKEAPSFSLMRTSPSQFCTPREAELAGYSASNRTYDYPNLTEQERHCLALIRNNIAYQNGGCGSLLINENIYR